MKPKNENYNNYLTEANLLSAIFKLSWPAMITMVFQSLTGVTDVFFLGRIGNPNTQAAIGIFAVLIGYLNAFNTVVGNGSISIISQLYGAGKLREVGKATVQTLFLKLVGTYILVIPCIIFLKPLLILFGSEGEALAFGIKYGIIILNVLPFMNAGYTFNTALRAAGDAVTPMYLMLATLIINIMLNILFINLTSLGIVGVALATAISQIFLFIIGLIIYSKGNRIVKIEIKELFKPDLNYIIKILKIGLPSGFQGILVGLATSIIIKTIASFGMNVVAAYTVVTRVAGLAMMPISGLSFATSTIVGQNIGANKNDRALKATKISLIIAFIITFVFFIIFIINPAFFLSIFSKNIEVNTIGKRILPLFAFLQIISSLISIYNAPLLGTGKLRSLLYISIISTWIIQIPTIFIFKNYLGINGIWISFIIANIVNLYFSYKIFKNNNWVSTVI